jgi:hypothetical protein
MHYFTVLVPHSNERQNNFHKESKIGENVRRNEVWRNVRTTWENKVEYESEKEYNSSLNTFIERCAQCPEFIQYVESTALCPIKEKFVRVLTDQVMYLGNTTTNRIESSLARLKKKNA